MIGIGERKKAPTPVSLAKAMQRHVANEAQRVVASAASCDCERSELRSEAKRDRDRYPKGRDSEAGLVAKR